MFFNYFMILYVWRRPCAKSGWWPWSSFSGWWPWLQCLNDHGKIEDDIISWWPQQMMTRMMTIVKKCANLNKKRGQNEKLETKPGNPTIRKPDHRTFDRSFPILQCKEKAKSLAMSAWILKRILASVLSPIYKYIQILEYWRETAMGCMMLRKIMLVPRGAQKVVRRAMEEPTKSWNSVLCWPSLSNSSGTKFLRNSRVIFHWIFPMDNPRPQKRQFSGHDARWRRPPGSSKTCCVSSCSAALWHSEGWILAVFPAALTCHPLTPWSNATREKPCK